MPDSLDVQSRGYADDLNRQCFCITLDRDDLEQRLVSQLGAAGIGDVLTPDHRHLFSTSPVFVPRTDIMHMQRIVQAIEAAVALPCYRKAVLEWAPGIAGFDPGPAGAFMGYDFHLGSDGPRLIEVNTNAGGAFLNAQLARAQQACCGASRRSTYTAGQLAAFEQAVVQMFELEWLRQRDSGRPTRVAIVDDDPKAQYLYVEFRLAQKLLQEHGIDTLIADPSELVYDKGRLLARGKHIDLVYNRLVDFSLEAPEHEALRRAYLEGAAVVTPNPHLHALLADKRNLSLLSDGTLLRSWGLAENDVKVLEGGIPQTLVVTSENADELWRTRRELFFKPVAGHGSKGVYRGSKLTKTVFARIIQGDYIAQSYVAPSERLLRVDDQPVALKMDVRLYTYQGRSLLEAARVYQGQTTNFRTPGGGFAPVFQLQEPSQCAC